MVSCFLVTVHWLQTHQPRNFQNPRSHSLWLKAGGGWRRGHMRHKSVDTLHSCAGKNRRIKSAVTNEEPIGTEPKCPWCLGHEGRKNNIQGKARPLNKNTKDPSVTTSDPWYPRILSHFDYTCIICRMHMQSHQSNFKQLIYIKVRHNQQHKNTPRDSWRWIVLCRRSWSHHQRPWARLAAASGYPPVMVLSALSQSTFSTITMLINYDYSKEV